MGGHYCCCVVDCKNNSRNSECKFYVFPKAAWKLDQRYKWIAAVKRKNVDGSPWSPKPDDKICSEHFISGKKSDAQASPSYVPTIFPKIYRQQKINESHALARYFRALKRRKTHVADTRTKVYHTSTNEIVMVEEGNELHQSKPPLVNQECQVNIFSEISVRETTFICNTFIYTDRCDAAIQVDVATSSSSVTTNNSKTKDKNCCTDKKSIQEQFTETKSQEFAGISSIKIENEVSIKIEKEQFTGVSIKIEKEQFTVTKSQEFAGISSIKIENELK